MGWIPDCASFDDEKNRIFDQIIDDTDRSWWIKGYAETGKTMMLVHLANENLAASYAIYISTVQHTQYGLTASNAKDWI